MRERLRYLSLLTLLFCWSIKLLSPAHAQVVPGQANVKMDKYGGLVGYPCVGGSGATGFFYMYKDTALRHWLWCDPEGYRYFLTGAQIVDYGGQNYTNIANAKYGPFGSATGWEAINTRRLQSMGFNGFYGGRSHLWYPKGEDPNPIPFIYDVSAALYSTAGTKDVYANLPPKWDTFGGYRGYRSFDVYDPVWQTIGTGAGGNLWGCLNDFGITCATLDASPWLMASNMGDVAWISEIYANQGTYSVAITAPYEQFERSYGYNHSQVFSTPIMYIKQQWANWLCATRYASLAALNVAWGSTYSTCGSSATTAVPETIGTGDGVTTSFAHTFSHVPVDPASVGISVGGVLQGGDTPWFNANVCAKTSGNGCIQAATGNINGSNIAYATGITTVTFSAAPANGVAITATYQYGGWPKATSGGTGLLDEDGTSSWWPAGDPEPAANGLPSAAFPDPPVGTIPTDMDVFLGMTITQYVKPVHDWLKSNLPHHLVGSVNQAGYGRRTQSYNAVAAYSDVLIYSNSTTGVFSDFSTPTIAQYNSVPLPVYVGTYTTAQPDSQFVAIACPYNTPLCFPYQASKGTYYSTLASNLWNNTTGADGYGFIVGMAYWQYTDNSGEQGAYGLVSLNDNVYDGVESTSSSIVDPYGLRTTGETPVAQTAYTIGVGDGVTTVFNQNIKLLPISRSSLTISYPTSTQQATDTFIRPDAGLGANWTTLTGLAAPTISSHTVIGGTVGGSGSAAFYSGVSFNNDQYGTVTVGAIDAQGQAFAMARANNSGGANGYVCGTLSEGVGVTVELAKFVAGAFSVLNTGTATVNSGDTFTVQAIGTTITCLQGTTLLFSITDASLASGSPGIVIYVANGGSLAGTHITSFSGGNLVGNTCTDNGNGQITGATCSSGTIQYTSPGLLNVTFSPAPQNGVAIAGAFTQNGFGGYQPSFVPIVRTQNALTQRNLASGTYSILSTNLGLEKPAMFTSATETLAATQFQHANDGDITTSWQPAATNPQAYRMDLVGKPSVSKIILRWGAVYATAYTLDWSDDGISWTTAFTQAAGAGGVETDTFTAVSHRYWRGNFTARSGAGSLQLQEMELPAQ